MYPKVTVSLKNGENIPLTKVLAVPRNIVMGFTWDIIQGKGPQTDVVPAVIALDDRKKAISPEHMLFFNQLQLPDGNESLLYESQDIGADKEQIEIALHDIPRIIESLAFVIYVNPDLKNPGTFHSLTNCTMRLMDRENNELINYTPDAHAFNNVSAAFLTELYRHQNQWKLKARGQGIPGGIAGVNDMFGVK